MSFGCCAALWPVNEKKKDNDLNGLLQMHVRRQLSKGVAGTRLVESIADAVTEIRERERAPGPDAEAEVSNKSNGLGIVSTDFSKLRARGCVGGSEFAMGMVRIDLVEHPDGQLCAWKTVSKAKLVDEFKRVNCVVEERLVLATTSACPSPFIIGYHGCCQTPRYIRFQMDGIGASLHYVYQHRELYGSEAHARYYVASVVRALQHLHSLQIVLRYLKPENCFLNYQGQLKLFDFSFSKLIVNKTWTSCGTPDYMAPEVVRALGHTFDYDWWIVGILTYELFAEVAPFYHEEGLLHTYDRIQKCQFTIPKSVPTSAKHLIRQLLVKDPSKRAPGSAETLAEHSFFLPVSGPNGSWDSLQQMVPPITPSFENGPFSNIQKADKEEIKELWGVKPPAANGFKEDLFPMRAEWEQFGPAGPGDEFP